MATYTCGLSGLPIKGGAKVRYLLFMSNPYAGQIPINTVTINGHWSPCAFPLRAEFQDFQSVRILEDKPLENLWVEVLSQDISPNNLENLKDFNHMDSSLQVGRLYVKNAFNEEEYLIRRLLQKESTCNDLLKDKEKNQSRLAQGMIREDVWQAYLKQSMPHPDEGTLDECLEHVSKVWEEIRSVSALLKAKPKGVINHEHERSIRNLLNRKSGPSSWCFTNDFPFSLGLGTHIRTLALHTEVEEKTINVFLKTAAEFNYIHKLLQYTSHQWRVTGNGINSPEWKLSADLHHEFAKIAQQEFKEEEKSRQEEEEEEEPT